MLSTFYYFLSQYVNELFFVECLKVKCHKVYDFWLSTLDFTTKIVENNGVEPLTFPIKIGTLQHQSAESSLVENNGVEPLTFPMKIETLQHQSAESSLVENNGVEPLTSCVQGRHSSQLS